MKRRRIDWYTVSLAAACLAGWGWLFSMIVAELCRQ